MHNVISKIITSDSTLVSRKYVIKVMNACHFLTYWYNNELCFIICREISDGFKISELRESHVENIYNSWTIKERYEEHANLRCWIRYLISHFHNICIQTEDGCPVAWQLQQEHGGLGMLYVEPEYRRVSLGSIVTRTLAGKLAADGQLVFACVDVNNETSIKFHDKNGYKMLPFKLSSSAYIL
jgi:ribosomal protein S18 acetylase RimI-like enzyme